MATPKKELPQLKNVPHAPENLHMSREEFMKKRRREKEIAARLDTERQKIEEELDAEEQNQDNVQTQTSEGVDDVSTVKDVKKAKKAKKEAAKVLPESEI